MKILVCFKITADLEQLSQNDYIVDNNFNIDTSFVKNMINCFDESDLEFGLRLSEEAESLNLHNEKSALTVGDEKSELYLKTLNALKYDHSVRICCNKDIRFDPEYTGNVIAEYVKNFKQDIIIMGCQAPLGNNFATPQIVSHNLGIPLIANVIDVHIVDENSIITTIEAEGSTYEYVVKTPIIISMGNAEISKLRVPTLKDRMSFGKRNIEYFNVTDIKHNNNKVSLEPIIRKRKGDKINIGGTQAVSELYNRYLKERLDNI